MTTTTTITLESGAAIELTLATADEIRGAVARLVRLFDATALIPRGNVKIANELHALLQLKSWAADRVARETLDAVESVVRTGKPVAFQRY